ncbi:MAG: DUF11 domain-containing protein [Phycisphaerales bacterium]|nr:DUF11 domain-containing protein [Phycisphaerales bacterium]
MNLSSLRNCLVLAMVAGAAISLGGCQNSQRTETSVLDSREGRVWEPAAAPATAEPQAEPKAATAATGRGASYRPAAGPGMNVNSMAFPTGDVATSGLWIHTVTPAEVRAGQDYEYQIHATNLTNAPLQNVMVANRTVQNLDITKSNPAAQRAADGSLFWNLGTLAAGETQIIRVTAKPGSTGVSSNCLSASYNNALCASVNVVNPALTITKQMTAAAILNCDPITATIEVTNTGTGVAENVVIKDTLPSGLTTADGKNTVEIPVGNLAAGQKSVKTVALKAASKGKFENNAQATASGGLTASSNTVAVAVTQPALQVTCKPGAQAFIGRDSSFEFTVQNTGDAASKNTVLTVALPAGVTAASMSDGGAAAGNGVTFNLGDLAPGASKTVNLAVRGGSAGQIAATATVTGTCAAAANTSCNVQFVGVPDIGTSISDADGVRTVGENHVFTYTVVNQGQVDLTEVKAVFNFTEGMTFVSTTFPGGAKGTGRNVEVLVGTVPVGGRVTFNIVGLGNAAGELSVESVTSSKELRRAVRNDEQVTYIGK